MSFPEIRPAAVAGLFYPAAPDQLRSAVESYLGAARAIPASGAPAKAVIAPHAGYLYSGPIAGSAFASLSSLAAAADRVERVILLGPSHFVPFEGLALPGNSRFATPLGPVEIEGEGSRDSLRLPQVRLIPAAHEREHSLEVELPFLQVLFPAAKIVALVVGRSAPEDVAEVLEELWGGPETRIVVSSDLSHYLPHERARAVDRETADAILRLSGPLESSQACGSAPINGLLNVARKKGLRTELLDLRTSADTAGDPSRVVGYGAFAFHE